MKEAKITNRVVIVILVLILRKLLKTELVFNVHNTKKRIKRSGVSQISAL